MMPKEFYRIEDGGWNGLFMSGFIYHKNLEEMNERFNDKIPNSFNDDIMCKARNNLGIAIENYRFCFNSLNDLRELITKEELEFISYQKYRIYRIVSKDYFISKYQAIIHKDKIIEKVDITDEILNG